MGKQRYKGTVSVFFTSFVFLFTAAVVPLRAQETTSLQVKPAIIEDAVRPGQELVVTIQTTNLSGSTNSYELLARDISGLTESGTPIFSSVNEPNTAYALPDWVTIPDEPIVLAPGESKPVSVTIAVPLDAAPGGHFGAVFLSTARGDDVIDSEVGSVVAAQVGTIISLRVPGAVTEEASLFEFSTDRGVYSTPIVAFSARLENRGNVLLRPTGSVTVTNMFGQQTTVVPFNVGGAALLPEDERQYTAVWDENKFAFGRYTGQLGLSYGDTDRRSVSAVTTFWILPLNVIAPVIVALVALAVIVWLSVKIYVRRKLRDAEQ